MQHYLSCQNDGQLFDFGGVHHVMDLALHCMNENHDADVDRALVICFGHRIANRGKAVCMDPVCRTWNPYYRLCATPRNNTSAIWYAAEHHNFFLMDSYRNMLKIISTWGKQGM